MIRFGCFCDGLGLRQSVNSEFCLRLAADFDILWMFSERKAKQITRVGLRQATVAAAFGSRRMKA